MSEWVRPVTLSGKFVRLEPLEKRHAEGLLAAGGDEAVWRYMPRGPIRTIEAARAYVESARVQPPGEGPQLPFAVFDLASGELAGSTRFLDIRAEHRGLEIGWTWYAARFQRTAVNTECKLLLLAHAFEVLGALRVQFKTDHANERSQRALERTGAVREGVLRNHRIRPDGTMRHSVYYSIIAEEWPAARQRLTRMLG